ncbi:hypothetical protein B0H13DRAFT_1927570 [Mycena leptocephala]|nr:hypothetical protein B0H13DRAFT_1927570 [Mycena leptocephala]
MKLRWERGVAHEYPGDPVRLGTPPLSTALVLPEIEFRHDMRTLNSVEYFGLILALTRIGQGIFNCLTQYAIKIGPRRRRNGVAGALLIILAATFIIIRRRSRLPPIPPNISTSPIMMPAESQQWQPDHGQTVLTYGRSIAPGVVESQEEMSEKMARMRETMRALGMEQPNTAAGARDGGNDSAGEDAHLLDRSSDNPGREPQATDPQTQRLHVPRSTGDAADRVDLVQQLRAMARHTNFWRNDRLIIAWDRLSNYHIIQRLNQLIVEIAARTGVVKSLNLS